MLPLILGLGGIAAGVASDLIGGAQDRAANQQANEQNANLQREFAQNGITWRIDDAARRGISPLAALGAPSASASASYVADQPGNRTRNMGQNISRAMMATSDQMGRNKQLEALQLEHAGLQNELLRSQIVRMNSQIGPPLPTNSGMSLLTGQGNSANLPSNSNNVGGAYVTEKPLERIHSSPGQPAQEVGAVPDYGYAKTRHGYAIVPSKDVKEKIEDQLIPEAAWAIRNQLMPNISSSQGPTPPDPKYYPLPKGYTHWEWSVQHQEFRPGVNKTYPGMMEKVKQSFKPTL